MELFRNCAHHLAMNIYIKSNFLKIADKLFHFGLMFLGFYFIYKGDIWVRFQHKRTNFAEYDEPMVELPAIMSWIRYSKNGNEPVVLGQNFHIYYSERPFGSSWWIWTKHELSKGINSFPSGWTHSTFKAGYWK